MMNQDLNQDPMAAAMAEQQAQETAATPVAEAPTAAPTPAPVTPTAPIATAQENQLQNQMEALSNTEGDMVPKAQVEELIQSVKSMFGGAQGVQSQDMFHEIGELAKFINGAKKEMDDLDTDKMAGEDIPDASNQLDAIIKMTEAATGRIMDECERMQSVQAMVRDRILSVEPPIDPDAMAGIDDSLSDMATSITFVYEACNFQDITGQRIQKVVNLLQEIERQVLRMVVVFGLEQNSGLDAGKRAEFQEDANLLNGPQLEGQGLDQDDIDDILSSLL